MTTAKPQEPRSELILETRHIVRRYPGHVALRDVTFRLYRNQVNVLIGENGAGKSTLMRILAGVEQPDEGEVLLEGQPVRIRSPREAATLGIAIVHQELSALPNLDVSENIFAGRELLRANMVVSRPGEDLRSRSVLGRLRQAIPVMRKVSKLSLGSRQVVELARSLAHGASILILDEPTSALSNTEVEALFAVIAELKAAGVTIVYISHRLHELLHLGDRFTVFRSGQVVGAATRAEVSREWIVQRMSGRANTNDFAHAPVSETAPVQLEVRDLALAPSVGEEHAQAQLHAVSFSLKRAKCSASMACSAPGAPNCWRRWPVHAACERAR